MNTFPLTRVPEKWRNQVKALRLRAAIPTQLALARQTGIPQYLITKWEKQETQPQSQYAAALAEFFDVTMDVVYGHPPTLTLPISEVTNGTRGVPRKSRT